METNDATLGDAVIRQPRLGQLVRLHYAAAKRPYSPLHGLVGEVVVVGRPGRGRLINHAVRIGDVVHVVPNGQLQRVDSGV